MRTIAHISDLHFGRHNPRLIEPLIRAIEGASPDLVVITGDLTQRAKVREFEEARRFLSLLHHPVLVVPGNHDIPLYRFWERFTRPYRLYRKYVSDMLEPHHIDGEVAIAGLDTTCIWKFKEGGIRAEQLDAVQTLFSPLPASTLRIVASHHPFNVRRLAVGVPLEGARHALKRLAYVDIFLSGHLHRSSAGGDAFKLPHNGSLMIQAGTALSYRMRGEANTFNVLKTNGSSVSVEHYLWDSNRALFSIMASAAFSRGSNGWATV